MILPKHTDVLAPGRFHRWIRSDMLVLRWVFLVLYLLIAGGLLLTGWNDLREPFILTVIGAMLISQALLIFGTGTIRLCHPIRRRRLILPVIGAATMLTLLVAGMIMALSELLYLDKADLPSELVVYGVYTTIGLSWIGWGVLLWQYSLGQPRYNVLARMTSWIFVGSLAELLTTVPSHIIVRRRPGCFVGMGTMLGIVAGLCVMFFSFGPMIFLLFLRPRHRAEIGADGHPHCPVCGYDLYASKDRCPECGLAIGAPLAR